MPERLVLYSSYRARQRAICNIYSKVGREAIDRPTVLYIYILYSTISAQQTSFLPENTSQNDTIFPKSRYGIYQTISQCLSSYGCAIIVLYYTVLTTGERILSMLPACM